MSDPNRCYSCKGPNATGGEKLRGTCNYCQAKWNGERPQEPCLEITCRCGNKYSQHMATVCPRCFAPPCPNPNCDNGTIRGTNGVGCCICGGVSSFVAEKPHDNPRNVSERKLEAIGGLAEQPSPKELSSWDGGPIWVLRSVHAQEACFNLATAERLKAERINPEQWQIVKYVVDEGVVSQPSPQSEAPAEQGNPVRTKKQIAADYASKANGTRDVAREWDELRRKQSEAEQAWEFLQSKGVMNLDIEREGKDKVTLTELLAEFANGVLIGREAEVSAPSPAPQLAIVLTNDERDWLARLCRSEIDDFETDGGVAEWYKAAQSVLVKLGGVL